MTERAGLISHQSKDGLLYVFVPGRHPDVVINQRELKNSQEFHVGDFIKFIEVNGSVVSPTRIKQLFETRIQDDHLEVKVPVAIPPLWYYKPNKFTATILGWSPDFAFVGCFHSLIPEPQRNYMYMAWIKRVPNMMRNVGNISVSWQIVDNVLDECKEAEKLIADAPWKKQANGQHPLQNFSKRFFHGPKRRPPIQRPPFTILKTFIDNYEGLVIEISESSALVWSLAIPVSDVIFFYGVREGMKLGDWVQFNCEPSRRPLLNCYLVGKKFSIIDPVFPTKAYNNTVMVKINTYIRQSDVKEYHGGEVTVENERLGLIEFAPGQFQMDFCDRRLELAVYKIAPSSSRTGAVWRYSESLSKDKTKTSEGVVIDCQKYYVVIWSKELGDVLWIVNTTLNKLYPGVWLAFSAVPLVPAEFLCSYKVVGKPKIISPLLTTRVVRGVFQIRTEVKFRRSAQPNILTAYSKELGKISVSDSIPKIGSNAYFGHTSDFSSNFIAWMQRRPNDFRWEIVDIVERCIDTELSTSRVNPLNSDVDAKTGCILDIEQGHLRHHTRPVQDVEHNHFSVS